VGGVEPIRSPLRASSAGQPSEHCAEEAIVGTGKILIIVTNAGEYEKVGYRTGLWLGELTHFYDYVTDNGFAVDIASPRGGHVPIDPESLAHEVLAEQGTDKRYRDREFMNLLENTKKAGDVDVEDYDAIYFTGGHGVMFDFRGDDLGAVTAKFYDSGRIVSAVCHGPAGLLNVTLSNGDPLVKGKNVTGFSWAEEEAAQRGDAVPFSLQDELKALGANYSIAEKPFDTYVVEDGRLITGQNPGSALAVAEAVVKALQAR
jgi:putative intracellular protease/amidase